MMKVAFMTLGCKVNFYETEKMKKVFEMAGYRIMSFEEEADIYIVNTCTVTNIADRKSRKMLHRAKRKNPDALVVAVGCYVDSSEERTDQQIDLFVSNKEKESILELVEKSIPERMEKSILERMEKSIPERMEESIPERMESKLQKPGASGKDDICGENAEKRPEAEESSFSEEALKEQHTRAFLNIQNGCNQYCTYCIIPYVRGELKSRPEEQVVSEVKKLARHGILEIVLTGIHLSSYGVDFSGKKNFLELEGKPLLALIRQIAAVDGIERIRLGSLEPRIITDDFVRELSGIKKVCPHFHLSLQSGSDTVLKRMNRHYTSAEYLEKVEILRMYYDYPAITTDIIVGFPGEKEQEFEETIEFVKKVEFSKVHVFKYSRRKGTMADAMEGQIPEEVKGKRSDALIKVETELEKKYKKCVEKTKEKVLFEEIVLIEKEAYLIGYTERYIRVAVKVSDVESADVGINTIWPVTFSAQKFITEDLLSGVIRR